MISGIPTFVLDFVNTAEEIKAAFEPYYEETVLERETDPNVIYDLKNTLDDFRVYQQMEVERFAGIFYAADPQKTGELGALQGAFKPALDRYKALELEKRELFKSTLARFNRIYAFITQVCRMTVVKAALHNNAGLPKQDTGTTAEEEPGNIEIDALENITTLIIRKAKGHGLARIVDAILRAKGFTTYVSPPGADKGVDILALSGLLGFGGQKICVQVKSGDAPADRIVLDQLGGVMKNFGADYGLLVSWSGFKSSVISDTAKQFFDIRLWTHKEIIEEFLSHYDAMDDEIKEMIPLKKIWIVNTLDE